MLTKIANVIAYEVSFLFNSSIALSISDPKRNHIISLPRLPAIGVKFRSSISICKPPFQKQLDFITNQSYSISSDSLFPKASSTYSNPLSSKYAAMAKIRSSPNSRAASCVMICPWLSAYGNSSVVVIIRPLSAYVDAHCPNDAPIS